MKIFIPILFITFSASALEAFCNFSLDGSKITLRSICPDYSIDDHEFTKIISRCPAVEQTFNFKGEISTSSLKPSSCLVGSISKDSFYYSHTMSF